MTHHSFKIRKSFIPDADMEKLKSITQESKVHKGELIAAAILIILEYPNIKKKAIEIARGGEMKRMF